MTHARTPLRPCRDRPRPRRRTLLRRRGPGGLGRFPGPVRPRPAHRHPGRRTDRVRGRPWQDAATARLQPGQVRETTEADVRDIAAHGFTLLRVATTWARLEPRPGRYDAAAEARLERVLGWADRYGLRVVVDFHQDVYGPQFSTPRGSGDDGAPAWATRDDGLPFTPDPSDWFAGYFQPAVQRAFQHLYDDPDLRAAQAAFYAHVARELRGHRSLLGYDLFNEPSGPIDGDPTDPAAQAAASAALEEGDWPACTGG
ncbi:cellulase family glycosylhydrolase [Streptacidiphilus monticola]